MRISNYIVCAVVIAAIAFSVFPHILFLRQDFFQDEILVIENALTFLSKTTISPANGFYPTFYSYISTPFTAIYIIVSSMASGLDPAETTAYLVLTKRWSLAIFPRILSLTFLISTSIIVSIFLINRFGRVPGIITGLLILLSPAFYRYGSYALPDISVLLFSSVSFLYCLKASDNKDNFERFSRYVMLSSVFSGIATAAKYNAAATVFPIAVLLIGRIFERRDGYLRFLLLPILAAFLCLIAFVAATPSWIFAPQTMIDGINFQIGIAERGNSGNAGIPILGQLELIIKNSPIIFALSAFSIINFKIVPSKYYYLCITMIIGTFLLSTRTAYQNFHYLYPLYPAILLMSACGLTWLLTKFGRPAQVLIYAVCFSMGTYTFYMSTVYLSESNLELAHDWVYRNLPENTKIGFRWSYVPRLFSKERLNTHKLMVKYPRVAELVKGAHKPYVLETMGYQEDWFHQTDVDYVIASSAAYTRYIKNGYFTNIVPAENSEIGMIYRTRKSFYEKLFSNDIFKLTEKFSSGSGPVISIYKRVERK